MMDDLLLFEVRALLVLFPGVYVIHRRIALLRARHTTSAMRQSLKNGFKGLHSKSASLP